jgi:uncharacterized protein (DUF697 family)
MPNPDEQKRSCLEVLAAVANLNGDPTPLEFEAFLAALNTFHPLPSDVTPETLLNQTYSLEDKLQAIEDPELQQQVYRGTYGIVKSKGIDPQEAQVLAKLQATFGLTPEIAQALAKQPLVAPPSGGLMNSALAGMASLIGREGDVRRLIFDYSMGAAIVGLIPLTGGGSLETKLLVVLGLILKMIWDIRNLWGKPRGQDLFALIGNMFGFMGAVIGGFLAWVTLIALGVVIPYAGAFAKAAGFATATWIAGQSTNQFYTSQKRPDLTALKRAFPNLMPTENPPVPPSDLPKN